MIFQLEKNKVILALIVIFIATQALGLFTAAKYMGYINSGDIAPVFADANSVVNSFYLFMNILVVTGIMLLLIKMKKKFIRVLEALAIFFTADIVFNFLFPVAIYAWLGLGDILAVLLVAWKMIKPDYFKQNIALIVSVAGAGAVLGVSLGVLPAIVFMFILSVYDFVSVFITKHMVYMAKAITETPTAFTAAIPSKEAKHVFQLGGGDLVMPLMFSSSIMVTYGLTSALFASAGALIALVLLFRFVLSKPGQALPALPPVCAGACLSFMVSLLI